ncbi:thiamine pyrophosphate-dependent enzyme [Streptomyces sp. BI20]|uniref:thiamine pyrophosphate-dependent enzyme n=1 Tax=Streptomyces sp. BI20 TaxID=3403460 RepID=UPI003C771F49
MTHDHDLVLRPTEAQIAAALAAPPGRTGADLVVETLRGLGAGTVFTTPPTAGAAHPSDGGGAAGGGAGADAGARADEGARADAGARGDEGARADAGARGDEGARADAGARADEGARADTGARADEGAARGDALAAALRRSDLRPVTLAGAPAAGHAADAHGRLTGEAAPLFLADPDTALAALPALRAGAGSPLLLVVAGELPAAHPLVGSVHRAGAASRIPSAVAEAWEAALTLPHGPVLVEIPAGVLAEETLVPPVTGVDASPHEAAPRPELTAVAAHLLAGAVRPVLVAGGGVIRADAAGKLRALAERLQVPVVCTLAGRGAFPPAHPLSLGVWTGPAAGGAASLLTDFLEDADLLVALGTTLGEGEVPDPERPFLPDGTIVQIDADPDALEAARPALGIPADARLALQALAETVTERTDPFASQRVAMLRMDMAVADASEGAGEAPGAALAAAVRAALPDRVPAFWDLTPATAPAWTRFEVRRPNTAHAAPAAPGGAGFALPAAIGAAAAEPGEPVLAVSDARVALGALAEVPALVASGADVTWLILDAGPELPGLLETLGLPTRIAGEGPDALGEALKSTLPKPGPTAVLA